MTPEEVQLLASVGDMFIESIAYLICSSVLYGKPVHYRFHLTCSVCNTRSLPPSRAERSIHPPVRYSSARWLRVSDSSCRNLQAARLKNGGGKGTLHRGPLHIRSQHRRLRACRVRAQHRSHPGHTRGEPSRAVGCARGAGEPGYRESESCADVDQRERERG